MNNSLSLKESDPLLNLPGFKFKKFIGRGSFGVVNLYDVEGEPEPCAVKFVSRKQVTSALKLVKREVLSHRTLIHPHVIGFKRLGLTPDGSKFYMMMEYANCGTLLKHIERQPLKRLSEEDSRWLFQQLVFGLDYCHQKTVANRDLKLENLLLSQDPSNPDNLLLKIADFGLAIATQSSNPKSRVGTLNYMAPEVLRNSDEQTYDGVSADVWSCGVILYAMLYGRFPFDKRSNNGNMLDAIKNARYVFPPDIRISSACRDLLRRILVADPAQRPTVQDILRSDWCGMNLPEAVLTMNAAIVEDQCAADLGQPIEEVERILGLGSDRGIVAPAAEDADETSGFMGNRRRPRPHAREVAEYETAAAAAPEDMGLDSGAGYGEAVMMGAVAAGQVPAGPYGAADVGGYDAAGYAAVAPGGAPPTAAQVATNEAAIAAVVAGEEKKLGLVPAADAPAAAMDESMVRFNDSYLDKAMMHAVAEEPSIANG